MEASISQRTLDKIIRIAELNDMKYSYGLRGFSLLIDFTTHLNESENFLASVMIEYIPETDEIQIIYIVRFGESEMRLYIDKFSAYEYSQDVAEEILDVFADRINDLRDLVLMSKNRFQV